MHVMRATLGESVWVASEYETRIYSWFLLVRN